MDNNMLEMVCRLNYFLFDDSDKVLMFIKSTIFSTRFYSSTFLLNLFKPFFGILQVQEDIFLFFPLVDDFD